MVCAADSFPKEARRSSWPVRSPARPLSLGFPSHSALPRTFAKLAPVGLVRRPFEKALPLASGIPFAAPARGEAQDDFFPSIPERRLSAASPPPDTAFGIPGFPVLIQLLVVKPKFRV